MSFKKIGDESPVIDFFDNNGKERFCPTCGRKLNLVVIGEEETDFVCKICDIEEPKEELN